MAGIKKDAGCKHGRNGVTVGRNGKWVAEVKNAILPNLPTVLSILPTVEPNEINIPANIVNFDRRKNI